MASQVRNETCFNNFHEIIEILKQEAQRGPSEAVNTAHVHQYNPRSVASRVVLTDVGRIDGRGRPLKCFLVLLSD